MQLVNRIVAALFALLLAGLSLLTIALATGSMAPERLYFIDVARATLANLPRLGTLPIVAVLAVAAVVLVFAGLLFVAQFRRGRGHEGYLVRDDDQGTFTVQPAAVAAIAAHVGQATPGVESVACTSRQNPEGQLIVRCKVLFRPGVPLEKTGDQYRETLRSQVEEMTGLKVFRLDLVAAYRTSRASRERRRHVV
jgi:hypothetical protein